MLSAMGITRVSDVTGLDDIGIPVFQAVRPNSRTLSVSQGKGLTRQLALISAVMESIEHWHAEEAPSAPLTAAVSEVTPGLPYSLFDLPVRARSLLSGETRLEWVVARRIGGTEQVWVPDACVRLDAADPRMWSPPLLRSNSNGLASGNTLEEALLHGLYEVVERDALAKTAKDHLNLELDLSTVTGDSAALIELLMAANVYIRVHDLTPISRIPCYKASIWSASLPLQCNGSGCHIDPDVALSRALTEAAQSRLTVIAGARDDIPDDAYSRVSTQGRLISPFSKPNPACSFPRETVTSTTLDEDLRLVTKMVTDRAKGGVFWVDLTRSEFGIPVVQIVAPGLGMVEGRQ